MQKRTEAWKIGVVIPWFGESLKGGAEQQAWQIATRLSEAGCEVTAICTCSESFLHSWHLNHYKPGDSRESGINIMRFPVRKRKARKFNEVVGKLLSIPKDKLRPGLSPITTQEEHIYWQENINSPELISYLKEEHHTFDFFIFLPYLFPSSMMGIEAIAKKSLLQPCLHDECYAYLSKTMEGFYRCKALLFNSSGEFQLAKNLYGDWISEKSFVIGEGVEFYPHSKSYRPNIDIPEHYILYLGRKCSEKNTPFLIEAFDNYCRSNPSNKLHLVLAGPEKVPLPDNKKIIDLGIVEKELKSYLLAHSKALINPSVNESFSRVIFESWKAGRPVVVHKQCLATFEALKDSGFSGWAIESSRDLKRTFSYLNDINAEEVRQLGKRGQVSAAKMSDWGEVATRYLSCFSHLSNENKPQIESDQQATMLLVIPQTSLNRIELQDLDLFIEAVSSQSSWPVVVLANSGLIEKHFCKKSFIYPFKKDKPPENLEFILWYGEATWDHGIHCISFLSAPILRKSLLDQSLERVKIEHRQLVLVKDSKPLPLPCPNLFSHSLAQPEPINHKMFFSHNKQGINILLLANMQNPEVSKLSKVFEELAKRFGLKVNISLPKLSTSSVPPALKGSDKVDWHLFSCSNKPSIPAHIYQTSDCLILLEPVNLPPWFSLGACAYKTPVLKIAAKGYEYQDFYRLNFDVDGAEKIITFLKLAYQDLQTQNKLQLINEEVLKAYIPGNPQTTICHSVKKLIGKGTQQ